VIKGLEPAWAGAYVLGRAFTARGAGADNLALHLAVAHALAGDVIVADVDGDRETAHCGGLLARAAMARGLAGFVLNGAIRDRAAIADLAYPIFHDGTSPRGPAKEVPGELGTFVELSGVVVHTGDLVCADDDGVVVVRAADADSVVHEAKELEAREVDIERRIIRGELTVGIFGLAGAE
jgi:4-hydroxy-4-methyl-2-oxoglutarate aldolase